MTIYECPICQTCFIVVRGEYVCPDCKTDLRSMTLQRIINLPPPSVEPVKRISAYTVRKEDGLDHPQVKHTCKPYPPFGRCVCGRRLTAAMAGD